jgi:hypothetical protein
MGSGGECGGGLRHWLFALGYVGKVVNDAEQGSPAVALTIRSGLLKLNVTTDALGGFFVPALVVGEYDVRADEDSLPPGYSTEGFAEPRKVTVGQSAPGPVEFTARALRNIAGRVLIYDAAAGVYVGVAGPDAMLGEGGPATVTNAAGRYLFRGLAAVPLRFRGVSLCKIGPARAKGATSSPPEARIIGPIIRLPSAEDIITEIGPDSKAFPCAAIEFACRDAPKAPGTTKSARCATGN